MPQLIDKPKAVSRTPKLRAKERTPGEIAAVNKTLDRVIEILHRIFEEPSAEQRARKILERELRLPETASTTFNPTEAGLQAVSQMQQAEGGAWTGGELDEHFHLTPATLYKRRAEHRIVWWRDARNRFHYPKWQFNAAGALWPGIQEVLQTFRSLDEWRVMRYFLAPRHQLGDRSPWALLRAGEVSKVIAHAKTHGEEDSW